MQKKWRGIAVLALFASGLLTVSSDSQALGAEAVMLSETELMRLVDVRECFRQKEVHPSQPRPLTGEGTVVLVPFDSSVIYRVEDLVPNRGRPVGVIKETGNLKGAPSFGIERPGGEVCVFMVLPLKDSPDSGVAVLVDRDTGRYQRAFRMDRKRHSNQHEAYACWTKDPGLPGFCPDSLMADTLAKIVANQPRGATFDEHEALAALWNDRMRVAGEKAGPWFPCAGGGCCRF